LKQLEAAIVNTAPDVYFLNLDRHKNRFENLRHQLDNLGLTWERIAAVDAQQASEEELEKYTDATGPIPRMGAGARACTVGHFKIWKKFLETDATVAFVLEDDVKISERFPAFVESAASYSNEVDILNFNRQNSKREQKKLVVSKINPLIGDVFEGKQLLGPHYGTAGYMITRSAAERLCNQIKRTNVPIDHLLFNPNVSDFNKSSLIYQAFPAMVEPDVEKFQTSIQEESVPTSTHWRKKLSRAYFETNRIPFLLGQYVLRRAAVQILDFDTNANC
jgi:glycosyl transferase family 25